MRQEALPIPPETLRLFLNELYRFYPDLRSLKGDALIIAIRRHLHAHTSVQLKLQQETEASQKSRRAMYEMMTEFQKEVQNAQQAAQSAELMISLFISALEHIGVEPAVIEEAKQKAFEQMLSGNLEPAHVMHASRNPFGASPRATSHSRGTAPQAKALRLQSIQIGTSVAEPKSKTDRAPSVQEDGQIEVHELSAEELEALDEIDLDGLSNDDLDRMIR